MLLICVACTSLCDRWSYLPHSPQSRAVKIAACNGHVECVKCLLDAFGRICNWGTSSRIEWFRCAIRGHAGAELLRQLLHQILHQRMCEPGPYFPMSFEPGPYFTLAEVLAEINGRCIQHAATMRNVDAIVAMVDATNAEMALSPCSLPCRTSRRCDACYVRHHDAFQKLSTALRSAANCGNTRLVAHLLRRWGFTEFKARDMWDMWRRAQEMRRVSRREQRSGDTILPSGCANMTRVRESSQNT
jgi:hypothetical protein